MPGLYLAGTCVALLLAAWDEPPIVGEPPVAGSSDGTGPTTGDPTTGTTGTGTGTGTSTGTGTGTDTGVATFTTSAGTVGTSTGDESSSSDTTATTDDSTASATSPTTTTTDGTDGGSFVEGDITGISYGYEDFEDGCDDPDDEDVGCCDSGENNSDNFCHISRRGRDRVAIAVLLVLLARPRRKKQ